ncbi:MAG: hypothetical protein EBX70_05615, partial [Betaproteobacteria bacterium]|nr:hypothetical protein [Betaproteobacteria bacterium]
MGLNLRSVNARRDSLERKYGIILETISQPAKRVKIEVPTKGFRALKENVVGSVIIGSDGHFWPGERSKAFAA